MNVADAFFDGDVLIYLFSADVAKADRAELLLAAGGTVSVQVLNEVASTAQRKAKLDFAAIRHILRVIRKNCAVKPLDVETFELGLSIAERHRFSIYDGMIIGAALRAGCRVLYSEDLEHGQRIEGSLLVHNPFRDAGESKRP
jgi:predicted nucleic acid-binding protein